jgi:hypothetical protein
VYDGSNVSETDQEAMNFLIILLKSAWHNTYPKLVVREDIDLAVPGFQGTTACHSTNEALVDAVKADDVIATKNLRADGMEALASPEDSWMESIGVGMTQTIAAIFFGVLCVEQIFHDIAEDCRIESLKRNRVGVRHGCVQVCRIKEMGSSSLTENDQSIGH